MKANLFIRFKGIDHDNDSAVDLAELGESLTGFDSVFKSFAEILRIEGGVEVKATATEKGSIIVDLLISLQSPHGTIPFESISDFIAFLKLTGSPACGACFIIGQIGKNTLEIAQTKKTLTVPASNPSPASFLPCAPATNTKRTRRKSNCAKRFTFSAQSPAPTSAPPILAR